MANTVFKLRRSSVAGKVPNTSTVAIGELAINLTDKILYSSDGSNVFEIGANNTNVNVSNTLTVKSISANGSVGGSGQVLSSNGSSVYWQVAADAGLPVRQQFTANGTATTFAVPGGYISNNISVFLNGVLLRNGVNVDVSSGTNFVITPAPANGSLIDIVGTSAITVSGINTTVSQQFTANGTANSFTITNGYIPNQIEVYLNGVKQVPGVDVVISSGNTVGFIDTPANGFIVDVYGYQTAVVATSNVLTVGANLVMNTSSITLGNSTVNTQITAGNIALNGSRLFVGNSTVNTIIDNTISSFGTNTVTIGNSVYVVANGRIGIGTSSFPTNINSVNPKLVSSDYGVNSAIQIIRHTQVGAGGGIIQLSATRGTSSVDYTALANNDGIGSLIFAGADGNTFATAASIVSVADATPSVGSMPTRMIFNTSASGSTSPTERMRIDSSGNVGIGTSSPSARLNVRGGRTYLEAASEPYSLYVAHNSATSGVFLGGTSTGGLQISNAGGGAWVNIDSSGRVTMPFMPAFWAVGSGTQSWSGASTYTKVNFASGAQYVTSNKSAGWSQANSRYTAPVGGTYEFMLSFAVQTGPSTGPAALLYKNGSAWLEVLINYSSSVYTQSSASIMLDLNANDYVEFWIVNYNNTSFTIDLGRCKFSGKLIG